MTHRLTVPRWHPATTNELFRTVRGRVRRKQADRAMVAVYARLANTPRAAGKRRVGLTIVRGPRQRGADVDAYWKSLLDALKHAGLIVDDGPKWCELDPVRYGRAAECSTVIELTDLED